MDKEVVSSEMTDNRDIYTYTYIPIQSGRNRYSELVEINESNDHRS